MTREVEITLAGKTHNVSVTFEVVERIEQRVEIMDFLRDVQQYRARRKDIAWVLYAALSPFKYTYPTVGEMTIDYPEDAVVAATEIIGQIIKPAPEVKKKETGPAAGK